MDVNNLVNNMTSEDYETADIIDKIEVAYYYCSAVVGSNITLASGTIGSTSITITDNQIAMAIALLAEALLIEGRKIVQSRIDPNIRIRSTDELFTAEMRNMLLVADSLSEQSVSEDVMWSNDPPTGNWSQ